MVRCRQLNPASLVTVRPAQALVWWPCPWSDRLRIAPDRSTCVARAASTNVLLTPRQLPPALRTDRPRRRSQRPRHACACFRAIPPATAAVCLAAWCYHDAGPPCAGATRTCGHWQPGRCDGPVQPRSGARALAALAQAGCRGARRRRFFRWSCPVLIVVRRTRCRGAHPVSVCQDRKLAEVLLPANKRLLGWNRNLARRIIRSGAECC